MSHRGEVSVPAVVTVERKFVSNRYEERRMRMLASLARGPRILDIGYAQWPNPYLLRPGWTVSGLDLEEPRERTGYSRELVGDANRLAEHVGNERFDTVVAAELIEHLERPYDFLRGVREVLARDGRLLLSTPNPVGWPTVLFEWTRSSRRFYTSDHTFYFSPRWVRRLLDRAGFELTLSRGVGLWPLGWVCPTTLSYQVLYVAEPRHPA